MPGPKATKLGHTLAKGLGIKINPPVAYRDEVTRGESVFSSDDTWVEEPPHTIDFFTELVPEKKEVYDYVVSLFPFLQWIGHYNSQWLIGDLVAGTFFFSVCLLSRSLKRRLTIQASPSAPSLFPRACRTPFSRTSSPSSVSTRPLWVSLSTGSLLLPKISLLVYVSPPNFDLIFHTNHIARRCHVPARR